jgi:hypothetical protein
VELKSQDVLLLLKLVSYGKTPWTYQRLSDDLWISTSQLYLSVRRCMAARLMEQGEQPRPYRPHVKEFLIHGVRYCFPADRGNLTRGIPTSYAAPPLDKIIVQSADPPPVWPYAKGEVRGMALLPIHRAAPEAAMKDPKLYEMLALLDAVREGRAREREIASRELITRIDQAW